MKKLTVFILALLAFFLFIASNLVLAQNGIDTTATINSFSPVGEFYKMDYSGDYQDLLDMMDDVMTGTDNPFPDDFKCSLFSANGDLDMQIFGRNFDNQDNDVLLTRYNPPNAYASLAFTRMTDMGFSVGTNYNNLTFAQKLPLLRSAYFVPDGINEHGLACALASVDAVSYSVNPEKDTIFVTRLIREILDHAKTCQEALSIANSFNVFDNGVGIISHHVLVGSVAGESLALEFHNGEFQAVETDSTWQVVTNIPVYNIPHNQLMNGCWRYASLYNDLQAHQGAMTWEEGMNALEQVHLNCPWSAIYDLNNNGIYIAIDNNYSDIAYTELEDFEFTIFVGFNEHTSPAEKTLQIFPNPCRDKIYFSYKSQGTRSKSQVFEIYDISGKKVMEVNSNDNGVQEINISHLQNGQFVITTSDGVVSYSGKFIIHR